MVSAADRNCRCNYIIFSILPCCIDEIGVLVVAKIKNENIQNKPQETVISANENEIHAKNPAFLAQKVKKRAANHRPPFSMFAEACQAIHRNRRRSLFGEISRSFSSRNARHELL